MSRLRNVLTRAQAIAETELAGQRSAPVAQICLNRREKLNGKWRLVSNAAHLMANTTPWLLTGLVDLPASVRGIEVAGRGFRSTVYRDGDEVIKVQRLSQRWSEAKRELRRSELEESQRPAVHHLGEFVVPQIFTIEQHPFQKNQTVVLARQRFVEHTSINLENAQAYPDFVRHQLQRFAATALQMHEETSHVPDLEGADNLVLEGEHVRLIDTNCLDTQNTRDRTQTFAYLDNLAAITH